jgi:hypothetical protein
MARSGFLNVVVILASYEERSDDGEKKGAHMLALNDDAWSDLTHAHGSACDIPPRLRMLAEFPAVEAGDCEPYASLWRDLLHRRHVYTASYAALPHMVEMMGDAPDRANWYVLELVTRIEIARARGNGPAMDDVQAALYYAAMDRLPEVIAAMARQTWDERLTRIAAVALAASKGQHMLAETILELKPGKLEDFMDTVADDE